MRENRASKLSGVVQMSDFRPKLEAGIRHAAPRGMNSSIQTRLIRISLIVAVLTAFAVGGLNVIKVKEKIRHQQGALKEQTDARQRAEAELSATRAALRTTSTSLDQTKATLESVTAEKEQALAGAAAQSKRAEQFRDDLSKSRQDGDSARAELARYKAAAMSPDE